MESNTIFKSIEALFKSQEIMKKSIIVILKITAVLIFLIFLVGYIASWSEIRKPEGTIEPFNMYTLMEGSLRYENSSINLLTDEYLDNLVAQIIDAKKKYTLNEIFEEINSQLNQKVILFPQGIKLAGTKIVEVAGKVKARNKKTLDSLNYVLRTRGFLDYSSTSIFDRINKEDNNLETFINSIDQINIEFLGDFPIQNATFSYQVGIVKSIEYRNNNTILFNLSGTAPVLSKEFLVKNGMPASLISIEKISHESAVLNQMAEKAEDIQNQKIFEEKKKINNETSARRWRYRVDFYYKWYSSLLLLVNSMLFILLLIRYWIIVRQKDLPRKSTDFVYYATNRTSRLFRVIALVFIFLSIAKLIVSFFVQLINRIDPFHLPFLPAFNNLFIKALIDPIMTFIVAIMGTWFLILMSEFIDFISNCYEIVFYKANKRDSDK